MGLRGLIGRYERREGIVHPDEILGFLPEGSRQYFEDIHHAVGYTDSALYLVAVIDLFSDPKKALEIIHRNIPKGGGWYGKNFSSFYHRQKKGYERRCQNGIPHDPELLGCELDSSPPLISLIGGVPAKREETSPAQDNAIRYLEGE